MPYFIILPAYVFLLLVLATAAIIARFVEKWRPASGYIVAGTVGTLPGFLIANVLVTVIGLLPVIITHNSSPPDWLHQTASVVSLGALMIGPFLASAVGVLLGFAAGAYFVFRRRRKHAA